jgi:hypothetical protein
VNCWTGHLAAWPVGSHLEVKNNYFLKTFSDFKKLQISRKKGAIAFTSHSITDYNGRMVHFLYRNPDAECRRYGIQ